MQKDIAKIVGPVVEDAGLYLEQVKLNRAGKHSVLRVTVDLPYGPGGVDSQQLEDATRAISAALDEADPVAGAYTLEVTTPGVERRMETERQFSRAIGRMAKFVLEDEEFTARVTGVDNGTLTLDLPTGERKIAVDQVKSAHGVVEF